MTIELRRDDIDITLVFLDSTDDTFLTHYRKYYFSKSVVNLLQTKESNFESAFDEDFSSSVTLNEKI